jgi:putative ABC transport system ATP-binding protein
LQPRIQLERVTTSRRAGGGERVPVLRGVSLAVARGEALALVGPSGAGKTTLLRVMNGLDPIDSGDVRLDGASTLALAPAELRRRVGMVFQTPRSLAKTVADEVSFGPRLRDSVADAGALAARAGRELERVGLGADFLPRPMTTLSAGEQQRVAIARALANDPEVLLLDEPTAALDPTATRSLIELLGRVQRELGLSLLVVSHALEQARALGGNVALLVAGEVVEVAPAARFFDAPVDSRTRDFVLGQLATGRSS